MGPFYYAVCFPLSILSRCVDKRKAVNLVLEEYRNKLPIVRYVLEGESSFKDEVQPIVEENLRLKWPFINGACRGKKFEEIGEQTRARLGDVFRFRDLYHHGTIDLTRPNPIWELIAAPMSVLIPTVGFGLWFLNKVENNPSSVYLLVGWMFQVGAAVAALFLVNQILKSWMRCNRRREYARVIQRQAARLDSIIRDNYKA